MIGQLTRARWAAFGAAVAVTLGLAGVGTVRLVNAQLSDGERAVFVPLTPVRILDTRLGIGGVTGPIVSGGSFELQVTGTAGIPAEATGVVVNVTATQTTAAGYIALWPAGEQQPTTSNLNVTAGQDIPNLVTVKLGAGGRLSFFNFGGSVQILADVAGYYIDHNHDDRYYTKAQVDDLLAQYVTEQDAGSIYMAKTDVTNFGVVRWAFIRDLGGTVEVYQENQSAGFPAMTVQRTATGAYEVTVPGVVADGAYHSIFVSPQHGGATSFRSCRAFQTVSAGDPADTMVVRVRCFDDAATLSNTGFHILVLH
jgi:hypothetical protein